MELYESFEVESYSKNSWNAYYLFKMNLGVKPFCFSISF